MNDSMRTSVTPLVTALGVTCTGVTRRYGRVRALDGLDLRVEPGTALGLVGSNGAGKSTLMRAILGLEPLDGGVVRFDGGDGASVRNAAHAERARIGFVPDHLSAFDWMTVGSAIDFVRQLQPRFDPKWADEVVAHLRLDRTKRVRSLSRGTQARLAFTLGVAHRPALLLLDEPFLGVDAVSHESILALLARLRDETACTIIVASHGLGDLARLTDRLAFIDRGRVVEEIATEEVAATTKRLIVRPAPTSFEPPPETVYIAGPGEATAMDGAAETGGAGGAGEANHDGGAMVITVRNFTHALVDRLRSALPDRRIDVVDLTIREACADRMLALEATP